MTRYNIALVLGIAMELLAMADWWDICTGWIITTPLLIIGTSLIVYGFMGKVMHYER